MKYAKSKAPIDQFLLEALVGFEMYLSGVKELAPKTRSHRMAGAMLFAEYIMGRQYEKYARVGARTMGQAPTVQQTKVQAPSQKTG